MAENVSNTKVNTYLNNLENVYVTSKTEDQRGDFDITFDPVNIKQPSSNEDAEIIQQAQEFHAGLIKNKTQLCKTLDLTSEQYDAFSCVALALASQETGMGKEANYQEENTGLKGFGRNLITWGRGLLGDGYASSGLTQVKISDFLKSNKLSDSEKQALEQIGVKETFFGFSNNLYEEPKVAAGATIVVLKSIWDEYENYTARLEEEKNVVGKDLVGKTEPEIKRESAEIITELHEIYNSLPDSERTELRDSFKKLILSKPENKRGEYCENKNLKSFNELLQSYGYSKEFNLTSLRSIQYHYYDKSQALTPYEFCAYAWNKGTDKNGLAPDRTVSEKIGVIFSTPEDFDYDQFTANVVSLANLYATDCTAYRWGDQFLEKYLSRENLDEE